MIRLLTGDCREALRTLEAESVDVTVTSPPYNLGGDFHTCHKGKTMNYGAYASYGDDMPESEYQDWQQQILVDLFRVTKPDGVLFYNHKNRLKDGAMISPLSWIARTPWVLKQVIVYDQGGTPNSDKKRFFPIHELIMVLAKAPSTVLSNQRCLTDIWRLSPVDRRVSGHPATFPIELPLRCLGAFPRQPGIALDPFMGVGTVGVACAKIGWDFIGIEIDSSYSAIAQRNVERVQQQPSLFAMQRQRVTADAGMFATIRGE